MAQIHTRTITSPTVLTIQISDKVTEISILAISGEVDVLGGCTFQGVASSAAKIPTGTSQTFIAAAPSPIEFLQITPLSGASASITLTI